MAGSGSTPHDSVVAFTNAKGERVLFIVFILSFGVETSGWKLLSATKAPTRLEAHLQLDYNNILASSSKPSKGKKFEVSGLFLPRPSSKRM